MRDLLDDGFWVDLSLEHSVCGFVNRKLVGFERSRASSGVPK